MEMISLNNVTIGFAENPIEVKRFLPDYAPDSFRMIGGKDRELVYGGNIYRIEKTNKKIGTEIGDVCPICRQNTLFDAAGCVTCKCGAQVRCGL